MFLPQLILLTLRMILTKKRICQVSGFWSLPPYKTLRVRGIIIRNRFYRSSTFIYRMGQKLPSSFSRYVGRLHHWIFCFWIPKPIQNESDSWSAVHRRSRESQPSTCQAIEHKITQKNWFIVGNNAGLPGNITRDVSMNLSSLGTMYLSQWSLIIYLPSPDSP